MHYKEPTNIDIFLFSFIQVQASGASLTNNNMKIGMPARLHQMRIQKRQIN